MKTLRTYSVLFFFFLCFLLSARTKDEQKAEMLYLQGLELYHKGDLRNAGVLLEEALALDPSNDAAHYYLAYIAAASNDAGKALESIENAYALDPSNIWYSLRLAHFYMMTGRFDKADTLYSDLARRKPGDPEILSSLAEVRLQESRFDEADSLLNIIERISGPSDYVDITRIELSRQKGDFADLFLRLDEYFSREGIPARVKKGILERMLKSSDPRFNYMHLHDYEGLFNTCLRTHPSDTSIAHLAGDFLYASDKQEKLKELCARYPDDVHMTELQAYLQFQNADYEGAESSCKRLITLAGNDAKTLLEALTLRADCLFFLKKYEEAFREYEEILRMDKDNTVALNNFAYYLSVTGMKLGKAERMSAKTIAAEPENATYLDTYGWILFKLKKYGKAREIFKKAMIYGGKDKPEVLRHYAEVLESLGESALAEGYRQQAVIKESADKK